MKPLTTPPNQQYKQLLYSEEDSIILPKWSTSMDYAEAIQELTNNKTLYEKLQRNGINNMKKWNNLDQAKKELKVVAND